MGRVKLVWAVMKPAAALVGAVILVPLLKAIAADAGFLGAPGQRTDPLLNTLASSWFVGITSGVVCVVAGFFFGQALLGAIRKGRADRWLRAINPDDVDEALNLQTVGSTPRLPPRELPREALRNPRSALSLAMLHLAAHFMRWRKTRPPGVVLITSTQMHEGKSTTAVGLARALAKLSYKVLLVDADFLLPSLHLHFRTDNVLGLADVAAGVEFRIAAREGTLDFLNAGKLSPDEAFRAAHKLTRMGFWKKLSEQYAYDFILVDGPPLITATAIELASGVDDVIFAVAATTPLARARAMLDEMVRDRDIDARVVLTMRPKSRGDDVGFWFYDYAYDYNYGAAVKPGAASPPIASESAGQPAI